VTANAYNRLVSIVIAAWTCAGNGSVSGTDFSELAHLDLMLSAVAGTMIGISPGKADGGNAYA
jgi:hypothetical protein